jgi:hypothetical protein
MVTLTQQQAGHARLLDDIGHRRRLWQVVVPPGQLPAALRAVVSAGGEYLSAGMPDGRVRVLATEPPPAGELMQVSFRTAQQIARTMLSGTGFVQASPRWEQLLAGGAKGR